jgi:teichuronic acid exporter
MLSFKQKTINGFTWSFLDQFVSLGVSFVVGIILARLLGPKEFGLIGMLTIFIAISQAFVDSGFKLALIRKQDCTRDDYSTVFIFNLGMSLVLFASLFLLSGTISVFFKEPQLKPLLQVSALILIVDALSIVHRTILTKKIDFKLLTKTSVIASLGSAIIALLLAYKGFGVWSLVANQLSKQLISAVLLWCWVKWKPVLIFSKSSFIEMFSFGSKLLVSGLIDTIYRHVYYLIIGRFFSAQELGFFTRAELFKNLPSMNLNTVITQVTYPVLSAMQHDKERMTENFRNLIRATVLITSVLMLGMSATAEPLIIGLIGEQWRPSVIYLQLLSIVGMSYPLHALNLNVLQVMGRSDLFLRLEIIKKIMAVPVILIAITMGVQAMIYGMMIISVLGYFINSFYTGKLIGYTALMQLKDIMPSLILAFSMALIVYGLGEILVLPAILKLIVMIITGLLYVIVISELFRLKDYQLVKQLIIRDLLKKSQQS